VSFAIAFLFSAAVPAAAAAPLTSADARQDVGAKAGRFVPQKYLHLAQIRIERRVIIRVPRQGRVARRAAARTRRAEGPNSAFREKKIGKCIAMNQISAVQSVAGRNLNLFTKDAKRIRIRLAKKCNAANFHSGFYMERTKDGRLCSGRDILHSRTGTKCEIDRFRSLILAKEKK